MTIRNRQHKANRYRIHGQKRGAGLFLVAAVSEWRCFLLQRQS